MEATFSKSNAHLLLLWHKSAFVALLSRSKVFFLPDLNVMFSTTNVFASSRTVWFAKNSTTFDEYGLTTAANNRLVRHRFGAEFCLHAQLANQESSSIKGIVCDGLHATRGKIHGSWILGTNMWSGNYSNARSELIWKTDVSKRSRSQ